MNEEKCTLTNFGEKKVKATVYLYDLWQIIGVKAQKKPWQLLLTTFSTETGEFKSTYISIQTES